MAWQSLGRLWRRASVAQQCRSDALVVCVSWQPAVVTMLELARFETMVCRRLQGHPSFVVVVCDSQPLAHRLQFAPCTVGDAFAVDADVRPWRVVVHRRPTIDVYEPQSTMSYTSHTETHTPTLLIAVSMSFSVPSSRSNCINDAYMRSGKSDVELRACNTFDNN
jgi:hypothetical protein